MTAESARGRVFADLRGDGRAEGQRGLADVLVSNGVDVVATDADGRYELPVREHTILFVVKPRGYRVPVNALNLPRFHYIHKPKGSPDENFIYKGVAPTGPLPSSVDFALIPQEEPDAFEMIFTADPQPYELQHVEWYARECLPEFRASRAAFGIALGDIAGDHLDLYTPYNAANARAGFPWYHAIGNHDLNYMAKEDAFAAETFKRVYGPTDYAFTHARVHFVVLNNVFWEGFTRLRADGWPRRGQYRGHLRPHQLEFVRNLVARIPTDERIVVCTHIPMVNLPDEKEPTHATPEFPDLLRILSSHPHTLSFSGHTHIMMNYEVGADHGYTAPGGALHRHCNIVATCGSWYRGPRDAAGIPYSPGRDGTPKGYTVVSFEGASKYRIRYKAVGQPDSLQLRVSLPDRIARADLGSTVAHVNVFNGTPRTIVRMRIDGGSWTEAARVRAHDPFYVALHARRAEGVEGNPGELPEPGITDHHWRGTLATNLADGWHAAEFEVVQPDGEVWSHRQDFYVVTDPATLEHYNQGVRVPRVRV